MSDMTSADQYLVDLSSSPVPKQAKTRAGTVYPTSGDSWNFRDGLFPVSLNFNQIPSRFHHLTDSIKKAIIWRLTYKSTATATGGYHSLIHLLKFLENNKDPSSDQITELDILTYRDSSQINKTMLSSSRAFLTQWHNIHLPGVLPSAYRFLKSIRLKQSPVGVAVATHDPEDGPLTDIEFDSVELSLINSYEEGAISTENFLLSYLFICTGARPIQIASLKCCDLSLAKDGTHYNLNLPRAKSKNKLNRSEFKSRRINKHLGDLLKAYIESIKIQFQSRLPDPTQAPMFPQKRRDHLANGIGFEYHCLSPVLASRVKRSFAKLCIYTARTDEPLSIYPYRLRRTFCQRAVNEGWPLTTIAELLDHTTTRHLKIYSTVSPSAQAAFKQVISEMMRPLANAFSGKIICRESDATRPVSESRIIDLRIDRSGKPMGNCGRSEKCNFSRPWACYGGCLCFEPWLDGPHEQALEYMLNVREEISKSADEQIVRANDLSIIGCMQVIQRCKEILSETDHDFQQH